MPDNASPESAKHRKRSSAVALALFILLSPILIPLLCLVALGYLASGVLLHLAVLVWWLPRRRRVLFVYSDSPNWKEYVETEILPSLPRTAVVLNWSQRRSWRRTELAVQLFWFYGGNYEHNPLGLVLYPFRPPKVFRFWRAFRDAKHGRTEALDAVRATFLKDAMVLVAVALFSVTSLRAQSPPSIDHHQHLFSPTAVALAPGVATVSADDLVQLLDARHVARNAAQACVDQPMQECFGTKWIDTSVSVEEATAHRRAQAGDDVCSFCGRTCYEVTQLVAGENGRICDICAREFAAHLAKGQD